MGSGMVAATRPATEYYHPRLTSPLSLRPLPLRHMSLPHATSLQSKSAVCPTTAARLGTLKVTLVAAQCLCRFHRLPDTERWGCRKDRRAADDRAWSMENGDLYRL